ncbi:unnamed protein product, partial [Nesidiocoris tenuis]
MNDTTHEYASAWLLYTVSWNVAIDRRNGHLFTDVARRSAFFRRLFFSIEDKFLVAMLSFQRRIEEAGKM